MNIDHVSNAEKWDISPETAQSVAKAINTTTQPIWLILTITRTILMQTS